MNNEITEKLHVWCFPKSPIGFPKLCYTLSYLLFCLKFFLNCIFVPLFFTFQLYQTSDLRNIPHLTYVLDGTSCHYSVSWVKVCSYSNRLVFHSESLLNWLIDPYCCFKMSSNIDAFCFIRQTMFNNKTEASHVYSDSCEKNDRTQKTALHCLALTENESDTTSITN